MGKCFVALCLCRVWSVAGAAGAPLGHHSAKASWWWFHVPDSLSGVMQPAGACECIYECFPLWSPVRDESDLFPQTSWRKQPWKWLFFIWREMWLSFQWTIVGFSIVGLESWLLRSRFLRLCWVGRVSWDRGGTKTHIIKIFQRSFMSWASHL